MDNQSQYLAQALRAMQEPQGQPQPNPQAMGLAQMQPGMGQPAGQPQNPNAPRPSIGDNLKQAWANIQGAPQRAQQSIMGLGSLFK